MRLGATLGAVALVLAVGGCSGATASMASSSLTIYGAASLKSVLAKVQESYEASHPRVTLTITTDSSAALEIKIEQGAPADVFLSADTTNPQKLVDKGLAAGPVVTFAGNKLAIIVPAGNAAGLASPADLAKPGVKIVAADDAVPISRYAQQLVDNLARRPGYSTRFQAAYAANIVSKEDNVAAIVAKIGLGEGDAAIVYVTDAKASDKVKTIVVPDAVNVPASYGGVVLNASPHLAGAAAFLQWLSGAEGQAILSPFGFLPPA